MCHYLFLIWGDCGIAENVSFYKKVMLDHPKSHKLALDYQWQCKIKKDLKKANSSHSHVSQGPRDFKFRNVRRRDWICQFKSTQNWSLRIILGFHRAENPENEIRRVSVPSAKKQGSKNLVVRIPEPEGRKRALKRGKVTAHPGRRRKAGRVDSVRFRNMRELKSEMRYLVGAFVCPSPATFSIHLRTTWRKEFA